jgi:CRISPR-associated protein Cst2
MPSLKKLKPRHNPKSLSLDHERKGEIIMSFLTAMMLIDAPASALNNSGEDIPGARTDNTSSVKFIRTANNQTYPYVTAQAVRYWLRNTLEQSQEIEWQPSIVYREDKVAYTDANPIAYWDDDLLGYMRAPSKSKKNERASDEKFARMTPMEEDAKGNPKPVTRAAPLRVSTFVSLAPVNITTDFGVMARQDGDPAPYEHQFYRATLHGLFSFDLNMAGKFFYRRRTGFQNLDAVRTRLAQEAGLEHLEAEQAYRLPLQERIRRIQAVLYGLGRLQGGAKQTLHYTDVTPGVTIMAYTRGGNHPFNYLFTEKGGSPRLDENVLRKAVEDARPDLLSPVFIGWKHGYLSDERAKAENFQIDGVPVYVGTPREAFGWAAGWLAENPQHWDN